MPIIISDHRKMSRDIDTKLFINNEVSMIIQGGFGCRADVSVSKSMWMRSLGTPSKFETLPMIALSPLTFKLLDPKT